VANIFIFNGYGKACVEIELIDNGIVRMHVLEVEANKLMEEWSKGQAICRCKYTSCALNAEAI
jgi:hypothetical protein